MSAPISWENIPPEIWFTIMEKLPVKSQVSLACTCRQFYRFSLDPLLRNIDQRVWLYLEARKPLPELLSRAVTALDIPSPTSKDNDIKTHNKFLQNEIERMDNLQKLMIQKGLAKDCFFLSANTAQKLVYYKNLEELKVPGSFLLHRSPKGKTLLHFAVEKRNKPLVSSLLTQMDIYLQKEGRQEPTSLSQEINWVPQQGKPPLQIAIEAEDQELILLLLKKGARGKEYLLSQDSGLSSMEKGPIEKGSHLQVNSLSSSDFAPFFAFLSGNRSFVSLGISEDFYLQLKKEERIAFFQGLAEALQQNKHILILNLRTCLEITFQEITPLLGCLALEELLLPRSCLDCRDEKNQNLLHVLVQNSISATNTKISASLIAQGVTLTARDHKGHTPVQIAQARGLQTGNQTLATFFKHAAQNKVSQCAFGKKDWETYYGKVGKELPLPDHILEILESPCPIWPEKKVLATHLLTLIPKTVNGKPLQIDYLRDLVTNPKQGIGKTTYAYYGSAVQKSHGSTSPASSYWILMTKDVLPHTRNKPFNQQLPLFHTTISKIPAVKGLDSYQVPHCLEAATSLLMEYAKSGVRFYSDEMISSPSTYTRCEESVLNGDWQVLVGGFHFCGLSVSYDYGKDKVKEYYGLGGIRKCYAD